MSESWEAIKQKMQDEIFDHRPAPDDPSLLSHRELVERVEEVRRMCLACNNCSVNIGAHALAGKILKILEGGK